MIPAMILQQTQYLLTTLRDKQLFIDRINEAESTYKETVQEIRAAVRVVDYGSDRIESNGKPDDKNIQMMLRLEQLEKKHRELVGPLWDEVDRINKLSGFIEVMTGDEGEALRMFYPREKNKAPAKKREIAEALYTDRDCVNELIRSGERKCAMFLMKEKLLF